jgi:hypothetical protein
MYSQIIYISQLEMGIDFWNKVYMDFFRPDENDYIEFIENAMEDREYPKNKVMEWVQEKWRDASYEFMEAPIN